MPHLRHVALIVVACVTGIGCVTKPTMHLHHAEVSGISVGFPPRAAVLMTVVIAVHNPNSYDVAVRAVRGQVMMAQRYPLPVDFRPGPQGVWMPSDRTTLVRVPVEVPVQLAIALVREAYNSPVIPFRFTGRADVTATSSFRLEVDNYAVDEQGVVSRDQIAAAMGNVF
jgi:hypothetical protein